MPYQGQGMGQFLAAADQTTRATTVRVLHALSGAVLHETTGIVGTNHTVEVLLANDATVRVDVPVLDVTPLDARSYVDFDESLAALPEDVAAEVIGGMIIEKAAPSYEHGEAQSSLAELLKPPFQRGRGGPGGWWIATEVEIVLATHEVYRPDVVGWRRERVGARPQGRPIAVRPDWVAEVLSVTNAERDLGTKLFAYQHAGIPHYWIIDPEHQTLTVYRLSGEGYVVALTAGKADRVHAPPFAELELAVGELFGE